MASYLGKLKLVKDQLGDKLYRADEESKGGLRNFSDINLLMVGMALGYLGVLGGAIAWVSLSRRFRRQGPPPLPIRPELNGLGGWLIVIGIGVCVGPLSLVASMSRLAHSYFSLSVWQEVAMLRGGSYHPLYGPLLMFEMIGNITLLGGAVLLFFSYFGKRRLFPKV